MIDKNDKALLIICQTIHDLLCHDHKKYEEIQSTNKIKNQRDAVDMLRRVIEQRFCAEEVPVSG